MSDEVRSDSPEAERWARTRELLYRALELQPRERQSWLDRECRGDAALRAELQSLIDASDQPAWIDNPILGQSPEEHILEPGATFRRYTVVELLGKGGMGVVYKALDNRLGRHVALKLMLAPQRSDMERRRFLQEARSASALNHYNIVTIYEYDSDNGLDYIAMEYIQGQTLHDILERGEATLPVLLGYARQIAGALSKAHAAGVVHRDLKPRNIMITADGDVKILDFGVARLQQKSAGAEDETRTQLTSAGLMIGTPAYMSPEQVLGDPVDHRSDIFAFGVLLYQMACGHRPFDESTVQRTYLAILQEQPRLGSNIPPALGALIERCLRKKREERLQSLAEAVPILTAITASKAPVPDRRRLIASLALAGARLAGGFQLRPRTQPAVPPVLSTKVTWSIEAQKMRDGKALGEPYTANASETFEAGWRFRIHASAPTAGYLYLINEGPGESGASRYWILHPASKVLQAERLDAGQSVVSGWYVFDKNPGTERVWLVWLKDFPPSLEQVRRNSATGEVPAGAPASVVASLLSSTPGPAAAVYPVELKHK